MVVFIGKTQKCVVIAILAILGTAGVTSGAAAAASATVAPGIGGRSPLVFRVQGSGCDPEYSRACGVVRGLEDLYGKERYRLHQVDTDALVPLKTWRRWLLPGCIFGRQLSASGESAGKPSAVVCSIESPSGTGEIRAAGVGLSAGDTTDEGDMAVTIGGVDELLEFVRDRVLAGPRPFSFAFHEQSLRLKTGQRQTDQPTTEPRAIAATITDPDTPPPPLLRRAGEPPPQKSSEHGSSYEFDLVVIGGGSGGLACAKEAAKLGRRVACLDYVKPSPKGSKWGLGGTCVNVGCIPKKLMHQAALHGGLMEDAEHFGWRTGFKGPKNGMFSAEGDGGRGQGVAHDWEKMVTAVQNYIKGLNFKYRVDLRSKGVEYINALGRLQDPHTVIAKDARGKERVLTCEKVVIAVGGRPKKLACEGGDFAITSDDLFSLKRSPGKTLVVGASYVALECAGFLTGLGLDTTVMVRSVLLRGFDQGMAERIGSFMEQEGTRFVRPAVPHRISQTSEGKFLVRWKNGEDGAWQEEEFDTVIGATGRNADVAGLGLEDVGVALGNSGKIICHNEETSVPGVFGIGDAVEGVPELTPSAIQAGRLLARRLFGGSVEAMDYSNVCTTVFTPLEYACCGLAEEDAILQLGEDNLEVYHSAFTPLEWQLNQKRHQNACYVKAVCDMTDRARVVGLHLLGPNAGEVMQGFGIGIRLGMTYDDLRQLVGIHPTTAEEITLLQVTKRSGEPIEKSGC